MATLTAAPAAPRLAGADANRMLAALTPEGQERLLAQALLLEVDPGDVLYDAGQPAPWVFFPVSCVVSIMTVLSDGSAVETATTAGRAWWARSRHSATTAARTGVR